METILDIFATEFIGILILISVFGMLKRIASVKFHRLRGMFAVISMCVMLKLLQFNPDNVMAALAAIACIFIALFDLERIHNLST